MSNSFNIELTEEEERNCLNGLKYRPIVGYIILNVSPSIFSSHIAEKYMFNVTLFKKIVKCIAITYLFCKPSLCINYIFPTCLKDLIYNRNNIQ